MLGDLKFFVYAASGTCLGNNNAFLAGGCAVLERDLAFEFVAFNFPLDFYALDQLIADLEFKPAGYGIFTGILRRNRLRSRACKSTIRTTVGSALVGFFIGIIGECLTQRGITDKLKASAAGAGDIVQIMSTAGVITGKINVHLPCIAFVGFNDLLVVAALAGDGDDHAVLAALAVFIYKLIAINELMLVLLRGCGLFLLMLAVDANAVLVLVLTLDCTVLTFTVFFVRMSACRLVIGVIFVVTVLAFVMLVAAVITVGLDFLCDIFML